jgi:uncharacterized membrane protein
MEHFKNIIKLSIIFCVIDYFYLSSELISNLFNNLIKKIQGDNIKLNLPYIFCCYIFLIFGLYYFVINNKNINNNQKIINAGLLGLVIYGVYETTNASILKDWTLDTVLLDTVWGITLFSLSTFIYLYSPNL